jgi:hypothetical protein
MKKTSTVQAFQNESFKERKLTIGLDLGDRWSSCCVMDEAGQVILEQKLPTRYLFLLVGAPRFELGTPCTPCKCATRLRHAPTR